MSSSEIQARLARTLVDFSSQGIFPEEEAISSTIVEASALPAALVALNNAKAELEVLIHSHASLFPFTMPSSGTLTMYATQTEIREISHENAPDVDSWIANAKSLQDDIETSRRLAGDIVQQATAEEIREETIRDKGIHHEFLTKENGFTDTLLEALRLLQTVNDCLDKAEHLIEERRILDAIKLLDGRNTGTMLGLLANICRCFKISCRSSSRQEYKSHTIA